MNIEKQINEITYKYFVSRKQYNLMSFSSGEDDYFNPYYVYYRNVEIAFSKLNETEQLIINNDYFYNDYYDWWKLLFPKKKYQKMKREAVRKFVRLVYENC